MKRLFIHTKPRHSNVKGLQVAPSGMKSSLARQQFDAAMQEPIQQNRREFLAKSTQSLVFGGTILGVGGSLLFEEKKAEAVPPLAAFLIEVAAGITAGILLSSSFAHFRMILSVN